MKLPLHILILSFVSAASILPAFYFAVRSVNFKTLPPAEYVWVLLIILAGYTEICAVLQTVINITAGTRLPNGLIYTIYTYAEWTALAYILLSYSMLNRWFALVPVLFIPFVQNHRAVTEIEMGTLIILGLYSATILVRSNPKFLNYRMIISMGVLFYCLNVFTYSYQLINFEFFQYMNITANVIYAVGTGVLWTEHYLLSSLFSGPAYSSLFARLPSITGRKRMTSGIKSRNKISLAS